MSLDHLYDLARKAVEALPFTNVADPIGRVRNAVVDAVACRCEPRTVSVHGVGLRRYLSIAYDCPVHGDLESLLNPTSKESE